MTRGTLLSGAILPLLCFGLVREVDLGPVWQSGPSVPYDELIFVPSVVPPFRGLVLLAIVAMVAGRFRFALLAGGFVAVHYQLAIGSMIGMGAGMLVPATLPALLVVLLLRAGKPPDYLFFLLVPLGVIWPMLMLVAALFAPAVALVAWMDTLRSIGWPRWRDWSAALALYGYSWHATVERAKLHYASLPTVAPEGCFIVTAASRGGSKRQLILFKAFEFQVARAFPRLHALLRRVYNRWGPILARRIDSRRRARCVRALLTPAELLLLVAPLVSRAFIASQLRVDCRKFATRFDESRVRRR